MYGEGLLSFCKVLRWVLCSVNGVGWNSSRVKQVNYRMIFILQMNEGSSFFTACKLLSSYSCMLMIITIKQSNNSYNLAFVYAYLNFQSKTVNLRIKTPTLITNKDIIYLTRWFDCHQSVYVLSIIFSFIYTSTLGFIYAKWEKSGAGKLAEFSFSPSDLSSNSTSDIHN